MPLSTSVTLQPNTAHSYCPFGHVIGHVMRLAQTNWMAAFQDGSVRFQTFNLSDLTTHCSSEILLIHLAKQPPIETNQLPVSEKRLLQAPLKKNKNTEEEQEKDASTSCKPWLLLTFTTEFFVTLN